MELLKRKARQFVGMVRGVSREKDPIEGPHPVPEAGPQVQSALPNPPPGCRWTPMQARGTRRDQFSTVAFIVLAGFLAGCGGREEAPITPVPIAVMPASEAAPTMPPIQPATQATTNAGGPSTEQPTQVATLLPPPSATPVPPTMTPIPQPTATSAPPPVTAIVQVEGLNVRAGPGTEYAIIGVVLAGDELTVTGKNEEASWFQIRTDEIDTGWVFGDLVQLSTADPTQVVLADAPAQPTAPPAPAATPLPPLPPARPLRMNSPEYGIQAFLWWRPELAERDLLMVKDLGFTWVKQIFAWRDIELEKGHFDWSRTDHIVYTANKYGGLDLLIRVDDAPDWAAPGCKNPGAGIIQGPPNNLQHFGDFLRAVVGRYKGRLRAYQIWNEPNLAREWCGRTPDPATYAQMLKVAYNAIKSVDPNAMVISAGMTPTGTGPPVALPDDVYLEQLYQAMGGNSDGYFDVLGVHAAGFKAPPETSPEEAANNSVYGGQRFFVFRRVEDLRAIMERYGDGDKQVAVLEFGWTSDPIHEAYAWHRVTEEEKADYLVRAYRWAKEHWAPWIGVMSAIYIADPDWTEDNEQYWWAITNPDGTPRPAFLALKRMPK